MTEEHGCAECGASGGHALYCVACAEKFLVFLVKKAIEQEREECAKRLEAVGCHHCAENIRRKGQE